MTPEADPLIAPRKRDDLSGRPSPGRVLETVGLPNDATTRTRPLSGWVSRDDQKGFDLIAADVDDLMTWTPPG